MDPFTLVLFKPRASGDQVIRVRGDAGRTALHIGFMQGKCDFCQGVRMSRAPGSQW